MSSTQNSRAVPIRTIIMILVSAAIILAAVGIHGLITRDDDPQAALNAQEAKLSAAATETTPAPAPAAKAPVCLLSVARAATTETEDTLKRAGFEITAGHEAWPARPPAPRGTTVFFGEGGEAEAKTVASALDVPTAPRPAGLEACAGPVAVAVVKK
ncbi:hypothetical protein GCM10027289_13610 [Tsukamurella serpentis]